MVYIEVLKLDIYYIIIQKTIYKLELKKENINIYNIYITKIKNSNNNNNNNRIGLLHVNENTHDSLQL